jgi:uncharacterized membrane protein
MTWLRRYRVRHYVENSLWIFPLVGIVVALASARFLHWIELAFGWESDLNPDTARAVLGTMASSMFTFIVFVCSALLVAVQLASAQLTPRIIAIVFKNPVTRFSLTVFVFTFAFTLAVLVRSDNSVYILTAAIAAYSSLACLGVFLYLMDFVGKWLRPSGALRAVAFLGRQVIESVYPRLLAASHDPSLGPAEVPAGEPTVTIANPRDGVVLAFDIEGLVSLAQRADCVIELVPQVGDFVAAGDPLFRMYQGGATLPADALRESIALGQERTMEQDPTFAFRIMVDIASKALSPAINDPTTAVLAIDQIQHLLRNVGNRCLDDERVRDAAGRLRLVYRTPDWEDYVRLAVTEIRHFGGESIQVARRLRAMLDNLIQTLPEQRAPLLRQELNLVHRTAERLFAEPEDRALADVSDLQGVGGKRPSSETGRHEEAATPP